MNKILVLHTSVGLGHKTIAENISYYLTKENIEVKLVDVLSIEKGKLSSTSTKIYERIVKSFPFVWDFLYDSKLVNLISQPLRVPMARAKTMELEKIINEFQPDLVITTQTTASALVSSLKEEGKYRGRFGIAFSDFHFHSFWWYGNADIYLANISEQKDALKKLGVPENKIFVSGITLPPKVDVGVTDIKHKLGIEERSKVILVSAGSLGYGMPLDLIDRLKEIQNATVVVVCGKNIEIKNEVESRFRTSANVKVLGFYSPMSELYGISDVYVSKAGALSVSEALLYELPLVITHMLPGQEKLNITYLVSKGLVTNMVNEDSSKIVEWVKKECESGELKQGLKAIEKPINIDIEKWVNEVKGLVS